MEHWLLIDERLPVVNLLHLEITMAGSWPADESAENPQFLRNPFVTPLEHPANITPTMP
jgi:hypothetical protein